MSAHRSLHVAGCELLVTCDRSPGLEQLPETYDHYPGRGGPPDLILHLERARREPTGRQFPDHPAFQWGRDEGGRVWLSRIDAEGWVDVPAEVAAPVIASFAVADGPHSIEAILRVCASIALPRRNVLILHASAVEHERQALIFAGKSGAGKSTLSSLLAREAATEKLSDELLLIRTDTGDPIACVSPFLCSRGLPHGRERPVRSVDFLTHAANHRRTPIPPAAAFRELMRHVLCYATSMPTTEGVLSLVESLATRRPCHVLEFAPRPDVAATLGIA